MRKITPNLVRLLVALAIVCSLVAIVAAPASAAVTANLSTYSGPVGTPVTVTLTGGAIPDAYLTVTFDGVALTTIPASPQAPPTGTGIFGFVVPATKAGAHNVVVSDGVSPSLPITFTVVPKVTVLPTSGPVGTTVTVTGTGFSTGFGGSVFIGAGNATLAYFSVVDSNGGFTVTGAVPALTSGNQTISAKDNAGQETAPANTAIFKITPSLSVSPTSGLAGTVVTLSGSGWSAGNITISFAGGAATVVPPVVGGTGQYEATYTIPATAALGASQILATDSASLTATTTFSVVARALTLTPASGPKGTTVLMTGANMSTGPGHSIGIGNLTFGINVWNLTQTITIDTGGTISPTTLTVFGNATVGTNTVTAKDDMGLIATATFNVTRPTIAINPTTGAKGSTVVVTGSGWVANKLVTIKINGTAAQTVTPDSSGNIAATAVVPSDLPTPTATFTADDAFTNASVAVIFTVPGAGITITPSSGVATTTVSVTGMGFGPYMPITVKIGAYAMTTQALTDALGAFTYTFSIPGLAPGVQVITATDLTPSTATTFFEITAAPVSINNQLAGISTQLVRVWGYFGGQWQLYDPADPAGSDLATLTPGRGYWVNVSAATQLIYQAYSYSLTAGWNLIGWR